METTASSFKLRANVPEGRKRFPINSPLAARSDANLLKEAAIRVLAYALHR